MKTIVKVLCVLMCLLMALSVLSACKKKDEPNPSDNTDNPAGPVDPVDPSGKDDPVDPVDPIDNPDDPVDPVDGSDLLDDQMRAKYPGMNVTGIAYPEDLLALVYIVNSSADIRELTENTVYYLAGDIDLNPYWVAEPTLDDEIYPPFEPAEPFEGFQEFYGIFDGNGHTISGVYLMSDEVISYDSIGFFWDLYGTVKDLTLENCFVCGKTESGDDYTNVSIGALAGRLIGDESQIENVSIKSTYVVFEGDESPDMGGVIGTVEGEGCALRSVSFEGQVILVGADEKYPSPAEDVVMAQIVGSAEYTELLLEDCLAGGLLFGVEPEEDAKVFCAAGDSYVTMTSCRIESPVIEEDPEGVISIRTKKDLLGLDPYANYAGITIRLMNDIDLNPGWVANDAKNGTLEVPDLYWNGIPEFAGTFDGQGHTLSGLCRLVNLDKEIYAAGGLVDLLCEGATIQNLTIDNSVILAYTTSKDTMGGVQLGGAIYRAEKNTTIKNVTLGIDIWTFGDVKGSFGGIQPYEPSVKYLTVEDVWFTGEIGNLEISNLSKLLEEFDPYSTVGGYDDEIILVSNAAELMAVMDLAQDGETFAGKTIRLTANIDLNPGIKMTATINPETNRLEFPNKDDIVNEWLGIPTFKGMFDGNGYAISGLYSWRYAIGSNNGNYGGFIDTAKDGAIIKNLVIRNSIHVVNNTGDSAWGSRNMHIGGLVARIDKTRGIESTFALTVSSVYVDMDVILLCSNHSTVGGILGFAVRHENEKDEEGNSLSNYTSPYRLENVVFAGRIINTNYLLKVPFTSPKDQFSLSQIVSDTNWGSQHVAYNVLAAGEIICGNEYGVHTIFGASTYSGVKCTNVISGRYITAPKGAYDPSKSAETAAFNSASWVYDHYLGFYVPQVISKMIADDELSDTINTDLLNRGFFVSVDPDPDEIHVSTAAELIALAQSGKDFAGATIYIDKDIDFNPGWSAATTVVNGEIVFPSEPAVTWTAFANFKGTINGQGHTISGLYSHRVVSGNTGNYGGLIDVQSDGGIFNLAVVNSIHIVENSGNGTKSIHIGGFVGEARKTVVKDSKDTDKYALGNSENYGFSMENVFTDMETWLVSNTHAAVGGILGSVQYDSKNNGQAHFRVDKSLFAGKVGNTNSMNGGTAYYPSAGSGLLMGQIAGCAAFKSSAIRNCLVVGQLITGSIGGQYVHTYVGADYGEVKFDNSLDYFPLTCPEGLEEDWGLTNGGYYITKVLLAFANQYVLDLSIYGNTVYGLTLVPKGSSTNVTISTTAMEVVVPEGVTTIADSAFENLTTLKAITLPSTLTTIGDDAFNGCKNLASITLPDAVKTIGASAFVGTKLTNLTLPASLTKIGASAFEGCASLTIPSIPENLEVIGNSAFAGCTSLGEISFPISLSSIGDSAFDGCVNLELSAIPLKVGYIGIYAFRGCSNLTYMEFGYDQTVSLTIKNGAFDSLQIIRGTTKLLQGAILPEDIRGMVTELRLMSGTTLEKNMVKGFKSLTTISLPNTITLIQAGAFNSCKSLTGLTIPQNAIVVEGAFIDLPAMLAYTVEDGNPSVKAIDGNLYTFDGTKLLAYAAGKTDTSFDIPSGVTAVGAYAFYNAASLATINFPSSVETVGDKALEGSAFMEATSGVVYIGDTLYKILTNNEETTFTVKDGTKSIAADAFKLYTNLETVILPEGIETIAATAFTGTNLATVKMPTSLLSVLPKTIAKNLLVTGTELEANAFSGYTKLESIELSDGFTTIDADAFAGLSNVTLKCPTSLLPILPAGVTKLELTSGTVEPGAFAGLASLTTVTLSIDMLAGNLPADNLTTVVLTAGTELPKNAFRGYAKLASITLPAELTTIGDFAFADTAIASITIPASVTSIGNGAFANCSKLVIGTATVANGNTVYSSNTDGIFKDDGATLVRLSKSKSTYTLPATVTAIEDYAFSGCSALINISVNSKNENYKAAGQNLYTKDGTTLVRAKNASTNTIAAGTVNIATAAFAGCDKLTKITLVASVESIGDEAFYGCSKLATVTNNASNLKHVGTDAFTGTLVSTPPTGSED